MESWREELYSNELYHHGIEGQKHGVRNGPPYPLSRSQMSSAEKRNNPQIDRERILSNLRSVSKGSDLDAMSNAELRERIDRFRLEAEFKKYTQPEVQESKAKGNAYANDILKEIGKKVLVTTGTGVAMYIIGQAVANNFNVRDTIQGVKDNKRTLVKSLSKVDEKKKKDDEGDG